MEERSVAPALARVDFPVFSRAEETLVELVGRFPVFTGVDFATGFDTPGFPVALAPPADPVFETTLAVDLAVDFVPDALAAFPRPVGVLDAATDFFGVGFFAVEDLVVPGFEAAPVPAFFTAVVPPFAPTFALAVAGFLVDADVVAEDFFVAVDVGLGAPTAVTPSPHHKENARNLREIGKREKRRTSKDYQRYP